MKIEPLEATAPESERYLCRTELVEDFIPDRGLDIHVFPDDEFSARLGRVSITLQGQSPMMPAARFSKQDMLDFARWIIEKLGGEDAAHKA